MFLVDDDPSVRRALDRLIRARGYEVQALADGAAYLACPVPAPPTAACIVLDLRMSGMDGLELHATIAGTPHALPAVFITGHGDEESRARAMASGAVDVLFKPINEGALFGAIERALAARRGGV